jgi:hypothetical protein
MIAFCHPVEIGRFAELFNRKIVNDSFSRYVLWPGSYQHKRTLLSPVLLFFASAREIIGGGENNTRGTSAPLTHTLSRTLTEIWLSAFDVILCVRLSLALPVLCILVVYFLEDSGCALIRVISIVCSPRYACTFHGGRSKV